MPFMKHSLLILWMFFSFSGLIAQAGLFSLEPAMLRKDTASLYQLNTPTPQKQKAKLVALAETWNINIYNRNNAGLRRDSSYSLNAYVSSDGHRNYRMLADKYSHEDLSEYTVTDLNKDGKPDLILHSYDFEYQKDSLDYPNMDNEVTFYISTPTRYFNKYIEKGRINTLKQDKDLTRFSIIVRSCCDEFYSGIVILEIDRNPAGTVRRQTIIGPMDIDLRKPFCFCFNRDSTFALGESHQLSTGIMHCSTDNRVMSVKAGQPAHIFYEGDKYMLVGFIPGPDALPCNEATGHLMLLQWVDKDFFRKDD